MKNFKVKILKKILFIKFIENDLMIIKKNIKILSQLR